MNDVTGEWLGGSVKIIGFMDRIFGTGGDVKSCQMTHPCNRCRQHPLTVYT